MFVSKKLGITAKQDIVVYIQIENIPEIKDIISLYLDRVVTPNSDFPLFDTTRTFKYRIESGTVNAYTNTRRDLYKRIKDNSIFYEAIIRKGTLFWVQDDLEMIGAESLYVTSNVIEDERETDLSFLYDMGADILLTNGNRVSLIEAMSQPKTDIKGIFAYKQQVMTLGFVLDKLNPGEFNFIEPSKYPSYHDSFNDYDGKKNTKRLSNADFITSLQKDVYLPAMGELKLAFMNLLSINLSRKALGLITFPRMDFRSSTLCDNETTYCINSDGYVGNFLRYCKFWQLSGMITFFCE